MAYFALKTTLGFKKVPERDADFHVETVEEYYKRKNTSRSAKETIVELQNLKKGLDQRILELERENYELKEELVSSYRDGVHDEQELVDKERKANSRLREEYRLALHKAELTEESLFDTNKEVERLESLNAHFLRVARERANRENGQSKKEGPGYAVTTTSQVKDKIETYGYDQHEVIDAWRTTIRTPYNASLLYDDIRKIIRTDLIDNILGPLGVDILQYHEKNGEYFYPPEINNDSNQDICMIYRWVYRANYRDEVWEIDLYHDKPIFVPEDFRMIPKTMSQTKKEGDKKCVI